MYSQEKSFSNLAKILSNYDRVIIDTCALMDEGFPQFMDTLVGSKRYWKSGLQIIIPKECIEELNKHANNGDWHYSDARIDAVRALNILKDAQRKYHVIQIAKRQQRKGDTFADPSILATATVLRIHYRVLIITQDKNLSFDLERLNSLGSQNGRFLATMRINVGGQLEGYSSNRSKTKDVKKPEAKKEIKSVTKTEKAQEVKRPAPKTEETKPVEPKPIAAPKTEQKPANVSTPKKEEKSVEAKTPRPFYEFGLNPTDAAIASAKRLNVLVRDPSIAYVKEIHGPADVTRNDLVAALPTSKFSKTGDSVTVTIKGLKVTVEKTDRDYKATASIEAVKPAEPAKKPETLAPAPKAKAPKVGKAKEPKTEKTQEAKPSQPKSEEVKAPAHKPSKPKKPAEAKPSVKKVASKETEPKVEVKKPAAPKKTPFERAQAAEKRLNANIPNPNFPVEKKLKEIDSFIKLYDKLSEDEKKQIKLTKESLLQQKESLK